MRVGRVQDSRIAETLEIVDAGVIGAAREARQSTRERRSARESEKIPAADGHAMSPRLHESEGKSCQPKQSSSSPRGASGLLRCARNDGFKRAALPVNLE